MTTQAPWQTQTPSAAPFSTTVPPWQAGTGAPPAAMTPWGARAQAEAATPWSRRSQAQVMAVSSELAQRINAFSGFLKAADGEHVTDNSEILVALLSIGLLTNYGYDQASGVNAGNPLAMAQPAPAEGCAAGFATLNTAQGSFCVQVLDPQVGAKLFLDTVMQAISLQILQGTSIGDLAGALPALAPFASVAPADLLKGLSAAIPLVTEATGIASQWAGADGAAGGGAGSVLPAGGDARIIAAANAMVDAWKAVSKKDITIDELLGVIAFGALVSNLGQVQVTDASGAVTTIETNNPLLLGIYDIKSPSECVNGSVYSVNPITKVARCIYTFKTIADGFQYAATSLLLGKTVPALLKGGDIERLVEGLLKDGYLYPLPFNKDNWTQITFVLDQKLADVAKALGAQSNWKASGYMPTFGDAPAPTPKPNQGEVPAGSTGPAGGDGKAGTEEEEKGWSTGAMVAAGVGVVAAIGLIGWGLSKTGSSATVAYQNNPVHPKVGSKEWYAGMPWVFAQAKQVAERVHADEIQEEDIPEGIDILVHDAALMPAAQSAGLYASANRTGFILDVPNIAGEDVPMDLRDRAIAMAEFLAGYGVASTVRGLEGYKTTSHNHGKKDARGKILFFKDAPPESEDERKRPKISTKRTEGYERLVSIFAYARQAAVNAAQNAMDDRSHRGPDAYLKGKGISNANLIAAQEAGLNPAIVNENRVYLESPVTGGGEKSRVQAEAIAKVLNEYGIECRVDYKNG